MIITIVVNPARAVNRYALSVACGSQRFERESLAWPGLPAAIRAYVERILDSHPDDPDAPLELDEPADSLDAPCSCIGAHDGNCGGAEAAQRQREEAQRVYDAQVEAAFPLHVGVIEHIDGNPLNNDIANLRVRTLPIRGVGR